MPCSPADPHWTAYVSALGTPIVALLAGGFGGYVAWRQWRTAQNRLKFDLFEKRLAIYKVGTDLINEYVRGGGIEKAEFGKFYLMILDARWLFSHELAKYLDEEILKPIQRHERIWDRLNNTKKEDRITELESEQDVLENKIASAVREYDLQFEKYLKLRH